MATKELQRTSYQRATKNGKIERKSRIVNVSSPSKTHKRWKTSLKATYIVEKIYYVVKIFVFEYSEKNNQV